MYLTTSKMFYKTRFYTESGLLVTVDGLEPLPQLQIGDIISVSTNVNGIIDNKKVKILERKGISIENKGEKRPITIFIQSYFIEKLRS